MRIIKAARKIHEVEYICPNCKSILGIESGDIRFDSTLRKHCIKCPVCNEFVGNFDIHKMFTWIMEDDNNDRELQGNNSVRINTL